MRLKIRLWQGFHGEEARELIANAWRGQDELLILCPPGLSDFSFLPQLPAGEVFGLGALAGFSRVHEDGPVYPDSPCLGAFTSGTAGKTPRLVLYTRRNILASLAAIRGLFDASRLSTVFCYPQPFHIFGLALGYVQAVEYGLNLVTGLGKYSGAFHEARAALTVEGTLTLGAPPHFLDLLAWRKTARRELSPSYAAIAGGARVTVELWRRMRDELAIAAPSIGYGASEASPGITHLPPGREPDEDGEIGSVLPGVSTRILYASPEDEIAGRPGEGLEFTGENLCVAMIQDGRVEFPKRLIIRDRVVRRARDGAWLHAGRTDLALNRGGKKLSLELIEEALQKILACPVVCVGLPDQRLGEDLGVLVQAPMASAQLRETARLALREHFDIALPAWRLQAVGELPLNASFKIDRAEALWRFLAAREAVDG